MNVNEQLAEELHKPVTEKLRSRKVCARLKDNMWAADLAEMVPLSSTNKNVNYLSIVKIVFAKYAWLKLLKDKKVKAVHNAFIKIVNEVDRKSNELSFRQRKEFYKNVM